MPSFEKTIILMKRGQCKNCKHWSSYSDGLMKCSFYGSQPRTTEGEQWCNVDNIKKFGFELITKKEK